MTCLPQKNTSAYPHTRRDRLAGEPPTLEMVINHLTSSHNKLLLASKLLRGFLPVLAASLERIACSLEEDAQLLQSLPTLSRSS